MVPVWIQHSHCDTTALVIPLLQTGCHSAAVMVDCISKVTDVAHLTHMQTWQLSFFCNLDGQSYKSSGTDPARISPYRPVAWNLQRVGRDVELFQCAYHMLRKFSPLRCRKPWSETVRRLFSNTILTYVTHVEEQIEDHSWKNHNSCWVF